VKNALKIFVSERAELVRHQNGAMRHFVSNRLIGRQALFLMTPSATIQRRDVNRGQIHIYFRRM
jgi:hypothetical protein